MATFDQAIMRGTLASRPAASSGTAGRLYFVTDDNSVWRDNGTAWESYNRPLGTTSITAAAGNHTHAHNTLTGIGTDDHHAMNHNLQGGTHPDVSTATPADGQFWVFNGTTGKWEPRTVSTGLSNPMTTQDDIIIGGASGVATRLAKGTDGQVLTVDPTTHHLVWATPASSGMTNPMTTAQDLIVGGTAGAPSRLGVGGNGQVLTVVSGVLTWATPASSGMANPMTTQDDLIIGGTSGTATRLAKGSSGQVLTVDATSGHLAWDTPASGGMSNPMTTAGDLIIGAGTSSGNYATPANGASVTVIDTFSSSPSNLIDSNDTTNWCSSTHFTGATSTPGAAAPWFKIDLGQSRTFNTYRLKQDALGNGGAVTIKLQTSSDGTTWTDWVNTTGTSSETGQVTVSSVTARYVKGYGDNSDTAHGWNTFSFEISNVSGTPGAPTRLAVGTSGQQLIADSTQQNGISWANRLKSLGSQTIGTTQVAINHGLGYTPTIVIAQMTSAGQIWRSAASTSTQVFFTADAASRTCEVFVR